MPQPPSLTTYDDAPSGGSAAPPSAQDRHGRGGEAQDPREFSLPSSLCLGPDARPLEWPTADPRHPFWTDAEPDPLPEWVTGFREHQLQAVEEIIDAYNRGAQAVFLDAPTGAGKTLIGEMVRRIIGGKSLYVCHSLGLQDQFLEDFPYARVLKGRSNYPTQLGEFPAIHCGDCDVRREKDPIDGSESLKCSWCYHPEGCRYLSAREAALGARIAVLNTAYLLAETNNVGRIAKGRELVIMDEADTLEALVMGTAEFRVAERVLRSLGIDAPKKGSHAKTVADWCTGPLTEAISARLAAIGKPDGNVRLIREQDRLERLLGRTDTVAKEILGDAWTRDYDDTGALILKPITVDHVGNGMIWRHAKRWLLMSATLVSTDEMVQSLGMGGMHVETVTVPMTFPVENRPIYAIPCATMTAKKRDTAWPRMALALRGILERHPDENVLVHTVSYDLAKFLAAEMRDTGHEVFTYANSQDRELSVESFRACEQPAVMLAPSLDRGFDFKGDDARVVVVCKVPYPYLGDRQVSERRYLRGGQEWYTVQAIRALVQMTGRGVRSADDWCATYILDSQFIDRVWKQNRRLLPAWWREAVDMSVTRRELGVR